MNLTEEQIEKAKQIMTSGASRIKLEQELKLSEREAYKLSIRLRVDAALQERPELLDDVRFLVEEGESRFHIHKQLGLPIEAVDYLISKANSAIVDDELKLEEEPALAKAAKRKQNAQSKEDLKVKVRRLMEEGYGALRIARELEVETDLVLTILEELRAASFLHPKMHSKSDKVDVVTRVADDNGGAFRVAKAMDLSPAAAQKLIRRVEGRSSQADDSFKMVCAKGTTVITLINKFGFKNKEDILEALSENFPEHFVYEKEKDDGDIGLTLIPDRNNIYEILKGYPERDFRLSVSEEENFMFVKFEDFRGDHMKLYNFTDVHVGHKKFQRDRLLRDIASVAADPNAYAVLGGDIIEWAHKLSVGDPWEQILSPMEQVPEAARLFAPIKHKILAYRSGNHDKGRGRHTGTDLAEVLATYLGVPYFKTEVVIMIDFTPARLFTVILDHGHSGSAVNNILRDANRYMEIAAFPVQAHFSGHVHNSMSKDFIHRVPDLISMKLQFQRSHTIVGGSYLGYTGTYAEEAKYAPTPQDLTYFVMNRDGSYDDGKILANPV